MSYILEALRKSQQERELGHVPTLQTPAFPAGDEGARPNLWIPVAVILAALAVAIALYSALRGGPAVPDPLEEAIRDAQTTAPENAGSAPAPPPGDSIGPAQTSPAAPAVVMEAPAALAVPQPPVPETPVAPPQPQPPAAPARESGSKVPPDLIADIEAFKREVAEKQSVTTGTAKTEEKVAPKDLRLPRNVRNRLPEFIMSAHIYDKDPAKRFVLINGLKTREGEESREAITVEEILPDGAVLSFDGNRFFQQRR